MKLSIGGRAIGEDCPALVIAEIGVNHDGSALRALELVDHAAAAGADAVKLQLFRADRLMHPSSAFADYQKQRVADANPIAMLRRYELSDADASRIVQAIRSRGMIPLATPFSPDDVPLIQQLDLPAVKIASPDLVNLLLLKCVSALGRPMLLSTGAATMEEVTTTATWLRQWGARFALLHCISSYPVDADLAHLGWIGELSRQFGVVIGYSDHTTEELAGALAVAAGASIVEKHLTYDRAAPGPDHAASADPTQFSRYVKSIRLAERLRGASGKRVLAIEEDVRRVSRQSLVLKRDIAAGQPIVDDDLTVQRPGTGIPPAIAQRVVGQSPRHSLKAGTLLAWTMIRDDSSTALNLPDANSRL